MPPRGDLDVMEAFNKSQDINPLEDPEIKDLLEEFHRSQDTFDLSQDTFYFEDDEPEAQSLADQSDLNDGSVTFDRWKTSFLKRLDAILAEAPDESRVKVLASYDKFSQQMDDFLRIIQHVLNCIDQGSISTTSVGVKGVSALNELKQGATDTMFALMDWMPTTVKEEQAVRYTKWQLGAVLVRKGFDVYETMLMARDMLNQAKEKCVDQVADRQTLDAIAYYDRQIVRFCDVMADLGLYELMVQAHDQLGEQRRQEKRKAVLKGGKRSGGKAAPKVERNKYNSNNSENGSYQEEDVQEDHGNGEEDEPQQKDEEIQASENDDDNENDDQGSHDDSSYSSGEDCEEEEKIDQPHREDENITEEDSNTNYQQKDNDIPTVEFDDNSGSGYYDGENSISDNGEDGKATETELEAKGEEIQVVEEDDSDQGSHDNSSYSSEEDGEEEESIDQPQQEDEDIQVTEEDSNTNDQQKDDEIPMVEFDDDSKSGYYDEENSISDSEGEDKKATDTKPETKGEKILVAEEDDNDQGACHDESSSDDDELSYDHVELSSDDELEEDADDKEKPHPYDEDNQTEEEDHDDETSFSDEDQNQASEEDTNAECSDPDDNVNPSSNGKGGGSGLSRPYVRLQFGLPVHNTYNRKIKHDDCILVPELFGTEDDSSNFNNLRDEISQLHEKQVPNSTWRTTADRTRMVCDNAVASSTVQMVVDKLVEYFGMESDSATIEVEMYRDAKDTKPASHDIM